MSMALKDFQVLEIEGTDRVAFLQGQTTLDVTRLEPNAPLARSAVLSPQGRVLATFWLWAEADRLVLCLLREQAEFLKLHLQKYVLRSKVRLAVHEITPARGDWIQSQWPPLAVPGERADGDGHEDLLTRMIRAQIAEVNAATRERFTAHHLNLDWIGAISFDKGCYTGQEIVVRTAHRGNVKRRLRLLESTQSAATDHEQGPKELDTLSLPSTVGVAAAPAEEDTQSTHAVVVNSVSLNNRILVLAVCPMDAPDEWTDGTHRFSTCTPSGQPRPQA